MRSVRPGGTIICCGATTGQNPGADLQRLFFLQLRVEGSTMGSRQELVDLVRFVSQAHIESEIAMVLPLDAAVTGVEAMLAGTAAGKIVFDIGAR